MVTRAARLKCKNPQGGGRKTDLVFNGHLVEELAYWTVVVCWSDGARLTSPIPVADG